MIVPPATPVASATDDPRRFTFPKAPAVPKVSAKAIFSLIFGILGVIPPLNFLLVFGVLAIVFGRSARNAIKVDTRLRGGTVAVAGIFLGWTGFALGLMMTFALLVARQAWAGFFTALFDAVF